MNAPFESDDAPLHDLLREARAAPPLPPRFAEAVWRRLEQAAAAAARPSPLEWLERWAERLVHPRIALAALAVLLVAGGLTGVVTSTGPAKQRAQERYLSAVAPNALR